MNAALRWQWLGLMLLLGGAIYLLAPVLTPFAVAATLAYLGDPVVARLQRFGMQRGSAVAVVFVLLSAAVALALLGLIPALLKQIELAVSYVPSVLDWVRDQGLPWLEARFGLDPELLAADRLLELAREHWRTAGGAAFTVLGGLSKGGLTVLGWLLNLLLIPLLLFYFLRDWPLLIERVHELIPRHVEPVVSGLARQADEMLGAFLRGQLTVMLALGLIYSIGLWAIGIDFAFLIGMSAGLISFVPYLGTGLGLLAGVIAALFEPNLLWALVGVLVVFGIGQVLEGFVLTPWLVGDRLGLHPVAVIFAVMAGGTLFGFLGVLLALPATAVILVVLRYAHEQYLASALYRADHAESASRASSAPPSEPVAALTPSATDAPADT